MATLEVTTDHKGNEILVLRCCSWRKSARTEGMSRWYVSCDTCKTGYFVEKKRSVATGREEWRMQ